MANGVRAVIAPAERRIETLPPYLSPKKACEILNCGMTFLYKQIGDKRFLARKVEGDKTLIDTASLLAFVDSQPEAVITPQIKRKRR